MRTRVYPINCWSVATVFWQTNYQNRIINCAYFFVVSWFHWLWEIFDGIHYYFEMKKLKTIEFMKLRASLRLQLLPSGLARSCETSAFNFQVFIQNSPNIKKISWKVNETRSQKCTVSIQNPFPPGPTGLLNGSKLVQCTNFGQFRNENPNVNGKLFLKVENSNFPSCFVHFDLAMEKKQMWLDSIIRKSTTRALRVRTGRLPRDPKGEKISSIKASTFKTSHSFARPGWLGTK